MKVYTKTGDKGKTSLVNGERVSKSHIRLKTYGTIDELNANTGMLASLEIDERTKSILTKIQTWLFSIGSNLAMPDKDNSYQIPRITEKHVTFLEEEIDLMDKELDKLTHFILPGGDQRVAAAHLCRTVCRRAERYYVELCEKAEIDRQIGNFINRLADFYFVLARKLMKDFDIDPIIWDPKVNDY